MQHVHCACNLSAKLNPIKLTYIIKLSYIKLTYIIKLSYIKLTYIIKLSYIKLTYIIPPDSKRRENLQNDRSCIKVCPQDGISVFLGSIFFVFQVNQNNVALLIHYLC